MSARLVDRAAGFLSSRLDRRSFIGRSAVVGSALVAAPVEFALKPATAYAAVCRCSGSGCACGSLCCDGYTEFCCTVNGTNTCPPGTVTGGWWKVDGSQFCGGAARYYLDCNAQCGGCGCSGGLCDGSCSGTPCGCAQGRCDNRKSGCTKFRYGQCHQDIACLGPIVCRVVTCTPPWQFDPSCGTTSRTDNATRNHDRACADQPFGYPEHIVDSGGAITISGWAADQLDYGQTLIRVYVDGRVQVDIDADTPRPDIAAIYPAFGPDHGFLVETAVDPGRHLVCVYAIDRSNGRGTFIGLQEVDVAGPSGAIDRLLATGGGNVHLDGWAVDVSRPGPPPTVRVRVDGVAVTQFAATVARPDVAPAFPGAGAVLGFAVELAVGAGSHEVCVDVVDRFNRPHPVRCAQVVAT